MTRQLPSEVSDDVREEVRAFLAARPDLTPLDLAHCSTLSDSTVRNFVSGHCPGGREVVGEMRRVLELARTGEILQPGGAKAVVLAEDPTVQVRRVARRNEFYQTQTVKRIAEVLDYCAEHAAIGVVAADFGAGKTESVAWWRRERRKISSMVFEFDDFSSTNKVDCVHSLARMLGVQIVPGQQNGGLVFRAVCEHLRQNPCLLIFDQCEMVRARVFQVLRQIWDRTHEYGVGMVLLSAPILIARMHGSRMADLGALTSRVGIWATLSGVTRNEMAAIVKREGIGDVDEAAFDLWWKSTAGSMRRLMRSLDLLKAKHGGRRVTEKTIAGVAGYLWGMQIPV